VPLFALQVSDREQLLSSLNSKGVDPYTADDETVDLVITHQIETDDLLITNQRLKMSRDEAI
jgi:hypothetical protein